MGEIVAWLHTMDQEGGWKWVRVTLSPGNPWGKPGKDYSAEYPVTTEPLVRAPARCLHCDGTGDVHSIDGEWRGRCTCSAGAPNEQA